MATAGKTGKTGKSGLFFHCLGLVLVSAALHLEVGAAAAGRRASMVDIAAVHIDPTTKLPLADVTLARLSERDRSVGLEKLILRNRISGQSPLSQVLSAALHPAVALDTCNEVLEDCLAENPCTGELEECCPLLLCAPVECLNAEAAGFRDACDGNGGDGGEGGYEEEKPCDQALNDCLDENPCTGELEECCPLLLCAPVECLNAEAAGLRDACDGYDNSGGDQTAVPMPPSDSEDENENDEGDSDNEVPPEAPPVPDEENDTDSENDVPPEAPPLPDEEDDSSAQPAEDDCVATGRMFGNETTLMDHMSLRFKDFRTQRREREGVLLCLTLSSADGHVCATANHLLLLDDQYMSMREVCATEGWHCYTVTDKYTGVKWNSRDDGYLPLGNGLYLTPHSTHTGRRVYNALAGRSDWLYRLLTI